MKKISEAVVADQIRKFKNHPPKFPDKDGQEALTQAFEDACDSDAHVREVGEYLLKTEEFCPVPASIYRAAEFVAQQRKANQEVPSLYKTAGDEVWHLADGLTPADVAKWEHLAEHAKTKAARELARAFVDHHRKPRSREGAA